MSGNVYKKIIMDNQSLENLFDNPEDNKQETHDKQDNFTVQKNNNDSNKLNDELSNQDQLILLKAWEANPEDPPSIEELCEKIRQGQHLDGRSKIGRNIKKFLADKDLKATTKTEYNPRPKFELTESQKEYVRNNTNMSSLEQSRILWNNPNLFPLSKENRAVIEYRAQLKKEGVIFENDNEDESAEEYRPPQRLEHACARINKNVDGANYDIKKLNGNQKKNAMTLINYLRNMRFAHQMGLINNSNDRNLLENTFIKYIFDKPDLTQEDLDQYIILANEAVMASSIQRTIQMLEQEQERSLNETNKISISLVDAIKTSREEYNSCVGRQQKLYKALTEERSARLEGKIKDNATVLNLVEAWKQKEMRDKMIQIANKRKQKVSEEIDRLETMDELKVRLLGISKDEVLEG